MANNPFGIRFYVLLAVVFLFGGAPAARSLAQSAVATASTSADPSPMSAVNQPQGCVLLRNDNVLFGQARQVGEFVVVQTSPDSEIQLPRQSVSCWADSLKDLYQYRVDHRSAGSLGSVVRDVRWCLRYDLVELAGKEIDSLQAIAPQSREIQSLAQELQRTRERLRQRSKPALENPSGEVVQTEFQREIDVSSGATSAAGGSDAELDDTVEIGEVDLHVLRGFVGHVQPMLINRCGNCHSPSTGRSWRLVSPPPGTRPSPRITRENLAATLPYLNEARPQESELLRMALTPHGDSGGDQVAPLDPRHAKAIEGLRNWLNLVGNRSLGSDSRFVEAEAGRAVAAAPPNFGGNRFGGQEFETPGSGDEELSPQELEQLERRLDGLSSPASDARRAAMKSAAASTGQPSRLPQVANPFDPEIFNRRFHPQVKATAK